MANNVVLGTGLLLSIEERNVGQNGHRVASLSLVISKPRRKNKQTGEYEQQPGTFVDVEMWNVPQNQVRYMSENLKNCLVTYTGRLEMDSWTDKNTGKERRKLKIVAESLSIREKPVYEDRQAPVQTAAPVAADPSETVDATAGGEGGVDQDIPF